MSDNLVKHLRDPDWVKNWHDQAGFQAADRIEVLEAKMLLVVKALEQIVSGRGHADDPWGIAHAALAELTGGKDE